MLFFIILFEFIFLMNFVFTLPTKSFVFSIFNDKTFIF